MDNRTAPLRALDQNPRRRGRALCDRVLHVSRALVQSDGARIAAHPSRLKGKLLMSDYFMGQIIMAGFSFAPKTFAHCDGRLMSIAQNQALYSLLGTQFGGDGITTFGLPDMRGRAPVAYGTSVDQAWQPTPMTMGQQGGTETVTLNLAQLPSHTHLLQGSSTSGQVKNPTNAVIGSTTNALYGDASSNVVTLDTRTCGAAGGNQPHPNMQPYSVVNFCIALTGIFPSRG